MDPTLYWVISLALVFARSTWWSCASFSSPFIMARTSVALVRHAGVGKVRAPPVPPAPSWPATLPVPGTHLMPAAPSGLGPDPPLEQAVDIRAKAVARTIDGRRAKLFDGRLIRPMYFTAATGHRTLSRHGIQTRPAK